MPEFFTRRLDAAGNSGLKVVKIYLPAILSAFMSQHDQSLVSFWSQYVYLIDWKQVPACSFKVGTNFRKNRKTRSLPCTDSLISVSLNNMFDSAFCDRSYDFNHLLFCACFQRGVKEHVLFRFDTFGLVHINQTAQYKTTDTTNPKSTQ